jgi:hypothetical protein
MQAKHLLPAFFLLKRTKNRFGWYRRLAGQPGAKRGLHFLANSPFFPA